MIFVTGGTGMVGGDIVRLQSQQGVAARALVRNPRKAGAPVAGRGAAEP
jgi:uncharacterized protein YbjT (DUF2867 family)